MFFIKPNQKLYKIENIKYDKKRDNMAKKRKPSIVDILIWVIIILLAIWFLKTIIGG